MIKYYCGGISILLTLCLISNSNFAYSPRNLQSSTSINSNFFSKSGFKGLWKKKENAWNTFLSSNSGIVHIKVFKDKLTSTISHSLIVYAGHSITDDFIIINSNIGNLPVSDLDYQGEYKLLKNNQKIEICEGWGNFSLIDEKGFGQLKSENCGLFISFNATSIREEDIQEPIVSYSFIISCISVSLIFSYSTHTQDCINSESTARKTSIEFLILQSSIDLFLSLWHLYLSTVYYHAFDYLVLASFMSLAVYLIMHGRLMRTVWKAQNPQFAQDGIRSLRMRYSVFEGYTFTLLTSFIPIFMIFQNYAVFFIILSNSFIPQIVYTAKKGYKNSIRKSVIITISLSRLSLLLYLFGCPANFLSFIPNYKTCLIFIIFFVIQASFLLLQNISPRFFLPKLCRPKIYSYFRDVTEEKIQETSECIICMTPLNLSGQENPEIVNFSRTMHTPCRHKFHEDCLNNWMSVKMECPTCRSALPLMEE